MFLERRACGLAPQVRLVRRTCRPPGKGRAGKPLKLKGDAITDAEVAKPAPKHHADAEVPQGQSERGLAVSPIAFIHL
jgi:hypothetical protein